MQLSALTSSLDLGLVDALEQLAQLGFVTVDVPPTAAEGAARDVIKRQGLTIGCVTLERAAPEPFDLAAADEQQRLRAVEYFRGALDRTAELGAPAGYLTPPLANDADTRRRWCESLAELARHAEAQGVDLCVEHFPRRLVPTVKSTLELLDEIDHQRLLLLLDVGHCQISGEAPADAIRAAGRRLGYVHFDDNDGRDDLHWPLLAGRLTEQQIAAALEALCEIGYQRAICLELNPTGDAVANLAQGKELLERFL